MPSEMTDIQELCVRIGQKVKALRKERGITQVDLAANCEFESTSVSRIEAGRTIPTLTTLVKIADALGVPVKDLLDV